MSINIEEFYSVLASRMKASTIRETLKIIQRSNVISLAGGMPDPATFPAKEINQVTQQILAKNSACALQYSSTEGLPELRELILNWFSEDNKKPGLDNIVITSGSQQGLDLMSKVLLNPGDIVIVELPSYLAALNAFRSYGGEMKGISMDNEGVEVDILEETLTQLKKEGQKVKFIYTISNFQNSAGVTMSLPRRKRVLEIAQKFEVFILEDNPYDKLRFEGEPLPSIYSLDNEGYVISLGTFSKILCPGLRLAWVLGDKKIIEKIVIMKQATDLCTTILNQLIVYEYCRQNDIDKNIESNIKIYRKKRDVMLKALSKYFPSEASWTKPEGGFFVFVTLPEYIDVDVMFPEAIEEGVAYVSGSAFFANGKGKNTMRLSFCYPKEEDIEEGIKRLGKVIKKRIKN
ncbi:aminotransferase [Candidatus Atribacteria bacterium CG2_30_33_13]|uniref:Aminotransferase n=1 Tax=Candidatus Infernicultor aquiphilus TaxID=1805029 RepID=A0A1J5G3Y7_9BACT|nr:MAG: aminotransferase [Candidatus Atribacteria bacterium CG2_30_33_13]